MTIKPPSWNEIRQEASKFALDYAQKTDEIADAQLFWVDFLAIFGIDKRRVNARFEQTAKRESTGGRGRIDMFWPRLLIVEHKSAGKNLEQAEGQALDYLESIDQEEWPIYVLTSNFHSMRIKNLETNEPSYEFPLIDLVMEIDRFGFLAGYNQRSLPTVRQAEANGKAAKLMGQLYESLVKNGYGDHESSLMLMRVLFLEFGDDTGMWETNLFDEFLRTRTNPDGTDLGPQLAMLFQTLDKPEGKRSEALDDLIKRFPYVNGGLFRERLDIPTFDKGMRDALLMCCSFDWGSISPAIFGSMFQSIKSAEARRELGEHYTSESNILKAIRPLFLDELHESFANARDQLKKLHGLLDRLGRIRVLDPACGCGNFLIVAYRELRNLELQILIRIRELTGDDRLVIDSSENSVVKLDHFFGIEIEEWPAEIARVAMFLIDHQANLALAHEFGLAPNRLPIREQSKIVHGNSLAIDWSEIVSPNDDLFIIGNPPFVGSAWMTDEQHSDNELVFKEVETFGIKMGRLDYVACWFAKCFQFIKGSNTRVGLVATNSVTQGEQARNLVPFADKHGIVIDFAHRTFAWSSEAPQAAAVHCVIIGFSFGGVLKQKLIYDYPDIKGEPIERKVHQINFYLVEAANVSPVKRTKPLLQNLPIATKGSQPTDGGYLILDQSEFDEASNDEFAVKYLRKFRQANEMLYGIPRYCLWLVDADPNDLRSSKLIQDRLAGVAKARSSSPTKSVREAARTPSLFTQIRQPHGSYLALPEVSSENREYIPGMVYGPDVIAGNKLIVWPDAPKWLFGVLQSSAFTAWVKAYAGRLESRYSISPGLTYFTFPFVQPTNEQIISLEGNIDAVLQVRAQFESNSLADLYGSLTMPTDLVKAHNALDKEVKRYLAIPSNATEEQMISSLTDSYLEITNKE
jgi:type I restriction-modification system DNA methylase subunit